METTIAIVAITLVVSCIAGGFAASAKEEAAGGAFLGLLLGPLGVIAALGLDGRQLCPTCHGRLTKKPPYCEHCKSAIEWINEKPYRMKKPATPAPQKIIDDRNLDELMAMPAPKK